MRHQLDSTGEILRNWDLIAEIENEKRAFCAAKNREILDLRSENERIEFEANCVKLGLGSNVVSLAQFRDQLRYPRQVRRALPSAAA